MPQIKNMNAPIELIIGLVCPLGAGKDKDIFIENLKAALTARGVQVDLINTTDEAINIDKEETIPPSFKYYIKMQICSWLRNNISNSILSYGVIKAIQKRRAINRKLDKPTVYLIDQLKNPDEYTLLTHVYGLNYLQLSLFSSEEARMQRLEDEFDRESEKDITQTRLNMIIKKQIHLSPCFKSRIKKRHPAYIKKLKSLVNGYMKFIYHSPSIELIKKDFLDCDFKINRDGKSDSGQQVSKLFHLSHYFFNIDMQSAQEASLHAQIEKFCNLLTGKQHECPTQDEFAMSLAYQASVRSNYPKDTQIGAAIISERGEVIAVASIRAPSPDSNTKLIDKNKVMEGYFFYKDKTKKWEAILKQHQKAVEALGLSGLGEFISDSLDFHPCTHAEIAALLDAAKLGISTLGTTLYTTTYPCHLCAKDIICAGVSKVVYLGAYPKSKNKRLYPNNITSDPHPANDKIPFVFYTGIGPKRYHYAYSNMNKPIIQGASTDIPLLRFEKSIYYKEREKFAVKCFEDLLENNKRSCGDALFDFLGHE